MFQGTYRKHKTMEKVNEFIKKMQKARLEKDTNGAVNYLQAATKRLGKLSDKDNENPVYYLKRANIYININAHKYAEKDLLKAISCEPGNSETLYILANVYLKTGEFKLSVEAYDKFFLIDEEKPCGRDYAEVYYQRAIARNGIFWYDEALADLDAAEAINPDLPNLQKCRDAIEKNKQKA